MVLTTRLYRHTCPETWAELFHADSAYVHVTSIYKSRKVSNVLQLVKRTPLNIVRVCI